MVLYINEFVYRVQFSCTVYSHTCMSSHTANTTLSWEQSSRRKSTNMCVYIHIYMYLYSGVYLYVYL